MLSGRGGIGDGVGGRPYGLHGKLLHGAGEQGRVNSGKVTSRNVLPQALDGLIVALRSFQGNGDKKGYRDGARGCWEPAKIKKATDMGND